MHDTTNDDLQRLIVAFLETGALLARKGEREGIIARAMIEAGVQALTTIGGPQKMAAALRQMADAVEHSTNERATNH